MPKASRQLRRRHIIGHKPDAISNVAKTTSPLTCALSLGGCVRPARSLAAPCSMLGWPRYSDCFLRPRWLVSPLAASSRTGWWWPPWGRLPSGHCDPPRGQWRSYSLILVQARTRAFVDFFAAPFPTSRRPSRKILIPMALVLTQGCCNQWLCLRGNRPYCDRAARSAAAACAARP